MGEEKSMITKIEGILFEKKEQSLILNVNGLYYEIIVPDSVLKRTDELLDQDGNVRLEIYHYFQIGPSSGLPILIGFMNDIERDFFLQFIKVSGIGPRAAVKALNKPISEITRAIESGDVKYLKTLSGIGLQRAKEIVAKLQGKIGKFGLIQDQGSVATQIETVTTPDWQEEALAVLLQLQYKKQEALNMMDKALKRSENIQTAEELLNEIYRQRVKEQ
jgi:holliday junction DNA helicase RuvA